MLLTFNHHSIVNPLNLILVLICHIDNALEFRTYQLSDQIFKNHTVDCHGVCAYVPEEVLDRANILTVFGVRGVGLDWDAALRDLVIQMLLMLLRRL